MDFKSLSLQEKIDTRENLITNMRALNDGCTNDAGETRSFTAEEKAKYEAMGADVKTLSALIDAEKRTKELNGFSALRPENPQAVKPEAGDKMAQFKAYLKGDFKALTVDGGDAGALAPEQFVKEILADVQSDTPILQRVNVIHLNNASSIGVPQESADADDADWTDEIPSSVTADSSWAFTKRSLGANQLIKLIKVSRKLLLTSAFGVDQLVREKLALKIRQTLEKAILTGDGSGKPLGLFTASANGISTGRDVTAASATAIDADTIIKTKRAVKQTYRKNGVWIFNPDVVTSLLTLKDKNDQYIWRSGLTPSDPDMLDGSPIVESDYAPSIMTTGLYAGLFGDLSKYWLTMVDQINIQVLLEKYAESGQVGYLGTVFNDGQPVLEEAFARIVLA
ncbi:MAG: phage major capsid protein [Treponema sp.]|nr:phage major capsid protein [Treponema sp.]